MLMAQSSSPPQDSSDVVDVDVHAARDQCIGDARASRPRGQATWRPFKPSCSSPFSRSWSCRHSTKANTPSSNEDVLRMSSPSGLTRKCSRSKIHMSRDVPLRKAGDRVDEVNAPLQFVLAPTLKTYTILLYIHVVGYDALEHDTPPDPRVRRTFVLR